MTEILIELFQFPKAPTNECPHFISTNAIIIAVVVFDYFESSRELIKDAFSGLFVKIFLHCHTA